MQKNRFFFVIGLVLFLNAALSACAPQLVLPGPKITAPEFTDTALIMSDGVRLPLHSWSPNKAPKAIILALHGFNDYGQFINEGAQYFADQGFLVYAYDQRGFGAAPHFGRWPGRKALADDLVSITDLLRQKHPALALFHLGASMGGAVIMTAATRREALKSEGLILAAPAVWGWSSMRFYERWALGLLSHTLPWLTLSGKNLNIKPSDNIEMLRALGRDPLIIKNTRVDTIWGLVNLMDAAQIAAPKLSAKTLILYGDLDEVIKQKPTQKMLGNLPKTVPSSHKLIKYRRGYHMLLRDLQAERVWRDIVSWIKRI